MTKRGMATLPKSGQIKMQESEDESLARFHRAVRDESASPIDMWSLPLETLGVCITFFTCIIGSPQSRTLVFAR